MITNAWHREERSSQSALAGEAPATTLSACHREERSLRRSDLKLRVKTGAMHFESALHLGQARS